MLLNARLKQLCKSIKAKFIDLSRELTNKKAMQKDGFQYGEEGIRVVTERLDVKATDGEEVWDYHGLGKGKHGVSTLESSSCNFDAILPGIRDIIHDVVRKEIMKLLAAIS
ncbi:hypothetical protein HPB47_004562 [Ixodes persulcatus]|uniref:Uncharacterized protein n=1 Tax=Ixodes persulcatus TaxID=34615 RepID=A0AC60PGD4_IXOPE|nr:hypothetical protein HPB47_004562 [Ixodes persulcatus]